MDDLQPIVVRQVDGAWQLVCGERRWRAHKAAQIEIIEAIERAVSDTEAFRLALMENLHRKDLSHQKNIAAVDQLGELVHAWAQSNGS